MESVRCIVICEFRINENKREKKKKTLKIPTPTMHSSAILRTNDNTCFFVETINFFCNTFAKMYEGRIRNYKTDKL